MLSPCHPVPETAPELLQHFLKSRRAEPRTDDELVRFHVGRRLENVVPHSTLSIAQNLASDLVLHEQMQVAIDHACEFALKFERAK